MTRREKIAAAFRAPLDFQVVLTPARLLFAYLIPMALVLAALLVSVYQQGQKNTALSTAVAANRKAIAANKRIIAVREESRIARAKLVVDSDRAICKKSNSDRDILGDIIRGLIVQADTPEQARRTREFFGDALVRLRPQDCDHLPSARVIP